MQNAQRVVFAIAARCSKFAQIGTCASSCNVVFASQSVFELQASCNAARLRLGHVLSESCSFQGSRGFASLKELTMPALSPTMTQGDLVEWKKKEGESLAPGDVIATVETDKATLEWESQEEGFLAKILVPSNSKEVKVGSVVALVADDEADIAAAADYVPGGNPTATAAAQPSASTSSPATIFPPHSILSMPALSPTMNAGDIASWHKSVGETVAPGDVLCEVGTDKATMAWEAQEEGFLAAIFKGSGSKDIKVGDPVALIVEDQGAVAAFAGVTLDQLGVSGSSQPAAPSSTPAHANSPQAAAPPPPTPKPAPPPPAPKPAAAAPAGDRVIASPLAKKLAREAGLDLRTITGTGPGGRVTASDVEDAIARGPAAVATPAERAPAAAGAAYTDFELNQIKRVTAKRLLESKQTIPHYYLTMECNIDQLLSLRKQVNSQCEKLGLPIKISVTDLVIKAAALALKKVPAVNSAWMGDFIRQYNVVDVSVAVMTPAGLMVPVVRSADKLGVQDISSSVKSLAQKAKENKLKPEEFSGGTFTISNLGMYGVKQFAAIVNPPQSAILAVGSPQKTVVLADAATQKVKEATTLEVTLSCDHRVVDGAVGAEWLQAFKSYVENPYGLVV